MSSFHSNVHSLILRLHHPKAHTPLSITNVIVKAASDVSDQFAIENIEKVLYFSAETDHILELIESESSVLSIRGPRRAWATAELDNSRLLAQVLNFL